jgi:hypothetical protein
MADDEGVTLGEVNRNVTGLRSDVKDLTKDVTDMKVALGTNVDKTKRLEAIVYGALGTALTGLIVAIMTAVLK